MNEANLVRQIRASRPKEGVSKGKTTPTPEGLVSTLFGSYDYKNQRIYTDMPGINPWNGQKFYYWNQSGAIIGEGKVGVNDYVARYFYSGNQKIAMERYDQTSGTSSFYYFINNAQGTPVLIVDEQNNAISKINLDEWGNVGDKTTGPRQEINYTGKKMDIPTRLYYFNQRYYDPEIGRFVNEDPAGQGMNPYAYCGNNPLMYTDPDGEFFQFLLMIAGAYFGGQAAYNASHGNLVATIAGAVAGGFIGNYAGSALDQGFAKLGLDVKCQLNLEGPLNSFAGVEISDAGASWTAGAAAGAIGGWLYANESGIGGGSNKYSDYEDPGIYLPGSGPGQGFQPGTGDINSGYGFRDLNGKTEFHSGVDFSPGDGYVYSRYSGIVSDAFNNFDRKINWNDFGNHVIIKRDLYSNQYSIYAHLSKSYVFRGQSVQAGDIIGRIGNTGRSTGPHLHYGEFSIQNNYRRKFYDPGL